jgi:hypothetical protein
VRSHLDPPGCCLEACKCPPLGSPAAFLASCTAYTCPQPAGPCTDSAQPEPLLTQCRVPTPGGSAAGADSLLQQRLALPAGRLPASPAAAAIAATAAVKPVWGRTGRYHTSTASIGSPAAAAAPRARPQVLAVSPPLPPAALLILAD